MIDHTILDVALIKAESFYFQVNAAYGSGYIVFPNNGEDLALTLKLPRQEKIELLKQIMRDLSSSGKLTQFPRYLYQDFYTAFLYVQNALQPETNPVKNPEQLLSVDELQQVWQIALKLHDGQKYKGNSEGEEMEYINHIVNVTFEILWAIGIEGNMNAALAIKCAILHDTIEDTGFTYNNILEKCGKQVADGVLALTKDEGIKNKSLKMLDSLERIKQQPKEVWAVKMADRISNLNAPPFSWTNEKREKYLEEAKLILEELKEGNRYLANRLENKIEAYKAFIR